MLWEQGNKGAKIDRRTSWLAVYQMSRSANVMPGAQATVAPQGKVQHVTSTTVVIGNLLVERISRYSSTMLPVWEIFTLAVP